MKVKKKRLTSDPQVPLFVEWSTHRFSKELQEISLILDDLPQVWTWVYDDLTRDNRFKNIGASGMTAEQVLRAAILKQQNCWSYDLLELQCVDSSDKMDKSENVIRGYCSFSIMRRDPSLA